MSSPQPNLREVDVFVRYAVPFEELWMGSRFLSRQVKIAW
jgi:hypothetical protein